MYDGAAIVKTRSFNMLGCVAASFQLINLTLLYANSLIKK